MKTALLKTAEFMVDANWKKYPSPYLHIALLRKGAGRSQTDCSRLTEYRRCSKEKSELIGISYFPLSLYFWTVPLQFQKRYCWVLCILCPQICCTRYKSVQQVVMPRSWASGSEYRKNHFKKTVVNTFSEYCKNELFTLVFDLLDHKDEDIGRFACPLF